MQATRKALFTALGMIVAGVLAFFLVLELLGIDLDQRPVGLDVYLIGGVLIGPGFGYLIRWRRNRDHDRLAAKLRGPTSSNDFS